MTQAISLVEAISQWRSEGKQANLDDWPLEDGSQGDWEENRWRDRSLGRDVSLDIPVES